MANENIYTSPDFSSSPFVVSFTPTAWTATSVILSVGSARATTSSWVAQWPGTIANLPAQIVVPTTTIASFGHSGVSPVSIVAPSNGLLMLPMYICDSTTQTTDGSLNSQVQPVVVIATAANFVPNGYDAFKQIGFVLVNTSGQLVPFVTTGNYNERYISLQDAQLTLSAGVATVQTTVPLVLGASAPFLLNGGITKVDLLVEYTPTSAASILQLVPTGLTPATTFPYQLKTNGTAAVHEMISMPVGQVSESNVLVPAIDYKTSSSSDSVTLYISGFTYSIPYAN
jgi:hypothetical protein